MALLGRVGNRSPLYSEITSGKKAACSKQSSSGLMKPRANGSSRHSRRSLRTSQAIYAAAKIGTANLLEDGSQSSDEVAESAGASPREVYRLLRFLASVGILAEDQDGRSELTSPAESLQTGVPGSRRKE